MQVYVNNRTFDYDVHSLIKAFYPMDEVRISESIGLLMSENETATDGTCITISLDPSTTPEPEDPNGLYTGSITIEVSEDNIRQIECTRQCMNLSRQDLKSFMKRMLYSVLSDRTGVELPWGTLTGIRPCKIPMKMLGDLVDITTEERNNIYSYMKDTYLVSDEKIKLSTDIAITEKSIIDSTHKTDGYSLYIGIPFCPTRCLYCSFTSYPIATYEKKGIVRSYIDALKEELKYVSEDFKDIPLDSVYIGGGTPTSISADDLREIIQYVKSHFDFSSVGEFTVEAGRPDSITREKLLMLKEEGVSRISINPQTMNDETLKLIGRHHTTEQIRDTMKLARSCGHDNVNMDIILGLPGEDYKMVANTMDRIKELKPDSLTVHSMAIKRAAGMSDYLSEHPELESVNTPEIMALAQTAAKDMGMNPYYLYRQKNMSGNFENTGYALPGKEGLYNVLIMEEVQTIIACGAGTVTKRVYGDGRIERCDNVKDVNLYISKIEEMIDRKRELFKDC